jgi:hypothetical protein
VDQSETLTFSQRCLSTGTPNIPKNRFFTGFLSHSIHAGTPPEVDHSHLLRVLYNTNRLKVFENREQWKMFGPKRDEVTGEWRRLHNEELYSLYSPNIIRLKKSRRMRWARHVARVGDRRGV